MVGPPSGAPNGVISSLRARQVGCLQDLAGGVEDADLRPHRLRVGREQVAAVDRDPLVARHRFEPRDRAVDLGHGRHDRDPALARDEVAAAVGIRRGAELLADGGRDGVSIQLAHASLPMVTMARTASSAFSASGPAAVTVSSSPTDAPRPRTAVMLRASARRPSTSIVTSAVYGRSPATTCAAGRAWRPDGFVIRAVRWMPLGTAGPSWPSSSSTGAV